ncbi:LOW QUALITY PROTEIN: anthrax toxin receptor-like [Balaenoptera musculus]|uniref:LOW QUALITY PROTEIN: anthrax toxin receptor-like n=1 Tax=Balaenoptera musculus TaxID=9771 RepID=A0A8B8VGJ4_BALMU|nr:LOW QUALITY PROTEIN: anthrax toxin receptor-like [Balaenoptera musculus]
MGSRGSGVPGPTLFLLLVLPPPLLSAGSFQHDGPGWKDLHHLSLDWGNLYRHLSQDAGNFHHLRGPSTWTRKSRAEDKNSCQSSFDLYFILDMSGSVNNNWMDIYTFVEDLVKKFDNPNLRMSFITYSTLGHTLMKLTSDRNEIRDGLSRLQNIVPSGATHMQEGFKKANEQIQQANSGGKLPADVTVLRFLLCAELWVVGALVKVASPQEEEVWEQCCGPGSLRQVTPGALLTRPLPASAENKVPSVIISLTDGTLEEAPFEMTKEEADKARKMGATVYCVGVKDFEEDQLLEIADSPRHVFGVDQGFKALKYIVEPLGTKSCIEITAVEPSSVCTGDENELMISGKGFNNAKKKDEVICRFKFSDKQFFDIKAKSVKDTSITCPGVKIEKPDQEVFVEVSLNNGVSVINNNVSITSKNCASTREGGPDDKSAPPAAPPAAPPTAQQPPEEPPSSPPPQFIPYVNPLYFSALIPALLLFLLVLWCIWWLCRRKTTKEPPPVQKPEREPEETCQMSCPTVIVPCGCQGGRMKRMEGKLDTLCDFVQRCNQMSLMWCPPRDMGKCLNFALMKPHCGQLHCSPKVCLQPSRECFSINSCCSRCQCPPARCSRLPSRMQPLVSPPARPRCGATLSLQPP